MSETFHASAVAWNGRGILIKGASGSGKSGLALSLMAWGCDLVGDDRVRLQLHDGRLHVLPAETISGLVEARGLGILRAAHIKRAELACVVDLDQTETQRMPPQRSITLMGCSLPLIYPSTAPNWSAGLLQLLKAGWSDR